MNGIRTDARKHQPAEDSRAKRSGKPTGGKLRAGGSAREPLAECENDREKWNAYQRERRRMKKEEASGCLS